MGVVAARAGCSTGNFLAEAPQEFNGGFRLLRGRGGGREVELAAEKDGKPLMIPFVVEDTGGLQNWKKRVIGRVAMEKAGSYTLSVKPKTKKVGAVMDLQRVRLVPVKG